MGFRKPLSERKREDGKNLLGKGSPAPPKSPPPLQAAQSSGSGGQSFLLGSPTGLILSRGQSFPRVRDQRSCGFLCFKAQEILQEALEKNEDSKSWGGDTQGGDGGARGRGEVRDPGEHVTVRKHPGPTHTHGSSLPSVLHTRSGLSPSELSDLSKKPELRPRTWEGLQSSLRAQSQPKRWPGVRVTTELR